MNVTPDNGINRGKIHKRHLKGEKMKITFLTVLAMLITFFATVIFSHPFTNPFFVWPILFLGQFVIPFINFGLGMGMGFWEKIEDELSFDLLSHSTKVVIASVVVLFWRYYVEYIQYRSLALRIIGNNMAADEMLDRFLLDETGIGGFLGYFLFAPSWGAWIKFFEVFILTIKGGLVSAIINWCGRGLVLYLSIKWARDSYMAVIEERTKKDSKNRIVKLLMKMFKYDVVEISRR